MPVYSFEDKTPVVDPTAFIAPTASVVGDVTIEAGATVGTRTIVLYDAVVGAGASLGSLSLLMKGEYLPPGSQWRGIPAQRVTTPDDTDSASLAAPARIPSPRNPRLTRTAELGEVAG